MNTGGDLDGIGAPNSPIWSIRLINGPLSWSTWPITDHPLLVGRSMGCHICIEDTAISRVQCEITLRDGTPYLRHQSQSVPTLLNGAACGESELRLGDVIESAGHRLLVDLIGANTTSSTAASDTPPTTQRFDESIFLAKDLAGSDSGSAASFSSDLLSLLTLQRMMADAGNVEAIAEALAEHFKVRFEGSKGWLALPAGAGEQLVLVPPMPPESRDQAPMPQLRQAMELGEGIHASEVQGKPVAVLAAPVRHAGAVVGAIAIQRNSSAGNFTRLHLHYLLAVAEGLGPLLLASQRMEQLRRDIQRIEILAAAPARIVGRSPAVIELLTSITRAAQGVGNVMLIGETGTGKELAARMLHDHGPRAAAQFVTINCAAIPDELFESECFGHERGAFSGAAQRHKGLFEQAHGGTLFLDEVGELSLSNQSKLLRAVENKTIRRIGGSAEIAVDLRIVCATNRPLQSSPNTHFRPDLFYRLSSHLIWLPPLRERTEDIHELAQHFLSVYGPHASAHPKTFTKEALDILVGYPWPGNIRELRNVVEQAAYNATRSEIGPNNVPLAISKKPAADEHASISLDDIERRHLLEVLRANQSNVAAAADALGIATSTLYYKLRRHKIGLRNPS